MLQSCILTGRGISTAKTEVDARVAPHVTFCPARRGKTRRTTPSRASLKYTLTTI